MSEASFAQLGWVNRDGIYGAGARIHCIDRKGRVVHFTKDELRRRHSHPHLYREETSAAALKNGIYAGRHSIYKRLPMCRDILFGRAAHPR